MGFALRNIDFDHPGRPLFQGLDLTLSAGRFVGIIGPNGCGKTTLLDLICRHQTPRAGEILFRGVSLKSYTKRQLARQIALVPQDYGINFPFSVREVVSMGRYPHTPRFGAPCAADAQRVQQALGVCDLEGFEGRPVTTLSGGERQRVIFARALAQDTPVLVLDEATANLDACHTLALLDLAAARVREKGCTVIAVFQDLNLAAAYSQELVIIRDGRVAAAGPTEAVLTAEHLAEVFSIQARVSMDDFTGRLQVRYKRMTENRLKAEGV